MASVVPKALSAGEEQFAQHCTIYGLNPIREYPFALGESGRKWRFDFAWVNERVAVEIEGGVHCRGRHVRPRGFSADLDKYNHASRMSWRVFRFTPDMVASGHAIDLMVAVLK